MWMALLQMTFNAFYPCGGEIIVKKSEAAQPVRVGSLGATNSYQV